MKVRDYIDCHPERRSPRRPKSKDLHFTKLRAPQEPQTLGAPHLRDVFALVAKVGAISARSTETRLNARP